MNDVLKDACERLISKVPFEQKTAQELREMPWEDLKAHWKLTNFVGPSRTGSDYLIMVLQEWYNRPEYDGRNFDFMFNKG